MKKTVFLMVVAAIVISLTGCAGSGYDLARITGAGNVLVNPPLPAPLKNTAAHGIRLSISNRSSLNINVEGILDYVQGDPMVETQSLRDHSIHPWVRWRLDF